AGEERDAGECQGVSAADERLLPGGQVPDPYGEVVAARSQAPAVGAEGHPGDGVAVAPDGADRLARPGVPELHLRVHAPGREELAVGTERHGVYLSLVPAQVVERLASGRVPDLHGRV